MSTLVFIHGAGCTADVFDAQVSAFPTSLAIKLPGHASPGTATSIDEFADAVAAELQARNIDDAILAGSSMGGAIALTLALRADPRVHALALLGSGARLRVAPSILDGLANDFEATTRTIAGYLYALPTPERIDATVAMMRAVGQQQTLHGFAACNAFDVSERLGEIALPVVAITGEHDAMTPPKYAQALADRIPGATARILPQAGHLAMIEYPEDTNEALRTFVALVS